MPGLAKVTSRNLRRILLRHSICASVPSSPFLPGLGSDARWRERTGPSWSRNIACAPKIRARTRVYLRRWRRTPQGTASTARPTTASPLAHNTTSALPHSLALQTKKRVWLCSDGREYSDGWLHARANGKKEMLVVSGLQDAESEFFLTGICNHHSRLFLSTPGSS